MIGKGVFYDWKRKENLVEATRDQEKISVYDKFCIHSWMFSRGKGNKTYWVLSSFISGSDRWFKADKNVIPIYLIIYIL